MKRTISLPALNVLTAIAGPRAAVCTQVEDPSITESIAAYGSETFGPYPLDRVFSLVGDGTSYSIAETTPLGAPVEATNFTSAMNDYFLNLPITLPAAGGGWNELGVFKIATVPVQWPPVEGATYWVDLTSCDLAAASGHIGSSEWESDYDLSTQFVEGVGLVARTTAQPSLIGGMLSELVDNGGGVILMDVDLQDGGSKYVSWDFHDSAYNVEYTGQVSYDTTTPSPHFNEAYVKDAYIAGYGANANAPLERLNRWAIRVESGKLATALNGGAAVEITGKTAWGATPPTEFGFNFPGSRILRLASYPKASVAVAGMSALTTLPA